LAHGLVACGTAVVTAATEGVQKVWEDRSGADQLEDASIATRFAKKLVEIDSKLYLDVSIDVWEGRAMLTGELDDAKIRDRIVAALKSDKAVKQVNNEIQIISPAEKEKRRLEKEKAERAAKAAPAGGDEGKSGGGNQTVKDLWIEAKIKAQLVTTSGIKSVHYRWRAVNNQVYVIGGTVSAEERDKVLRILRETENVKSVKSFIAVKPNLASGAK
jgi:osmotically-inducible protein OsmY